jgi:sec-independent protein translocase protein TatA
MGFGSWWHWALVIVIVLLLFGGRGKLSGLMGDAAKGIRAFKDGLKGDDGHAETKTDTLPRSEREKEEVR